MAYHLVLPLVILVRPYVHTEQGFKYPFEIVQAPVALRTTGYRLAAHMLW